MSRRAKPRRGRPPMPAGAAATETVRLRLTSAQRDAWLEAADRESLTLSDWLRAAAELAIARGSTR